MNMISQIINEIATVFADNSGNENIEQYIIQLNNAEDDACEFSELVAIKYNKCVLLDKFAGGAETEFRQNLGELNALLLSPLIDDSSASDEFYFNVAKLNFKVHDCETANLLLDKSIRQEKGEVDFNNISLRYDKRCLKGYCLEYIALTNVKHHMFNECGSAKGTIRIGTLNRFYKEVFKFLTGKSIEDFSNLSDEIIPLTVDLYKSEMGYTGENKSSIEIALNGINATKGFLYEIAETYKPVLESMGKNAKYNDYINEFAHILAHCLSEYCKIMPLVSTIDRNGRTNFIYFLRLSDVLMHKLGVDYASCFATLKIEKKEYFHAIEQMFSAKRKKLLELKALPCESEEYLKQEKEIAQLNFYIWYFSFITKIQVDGQCKKEFYEYSIKENDFVAQTYYSIFDFKEMLSKAFIDLKLDMLETAVVTRLQECKTSFDKHKPNKTFPIEIIDECKVLSSAYDAFIYSYRFIKSGCADLVSLYKLQKDMLYSSSTFLQEAEYVKSNDKVKGIWMVSVGATSFAYKGYITNLKISLAKIGTHFSKSPKVFDNLESLFDKYNGANILVFVRDETFYSDIDFIIGVAIRDNKSNNPAEHHNIFVDLSILKDSEKIREFEEKVLNKHHNVKSFSVQEITVRQCVMFSVLEEYWNRLNNPLEAYVISPVKSSKSYSFQDCSILTPLSYDKFLGFKGSDAFSSWSKTFKNDFVACYSVEKISHRYPKQLRQENLSSISIKEKIKYIVYLKTESDESIIYSFNLQEELCVSDGIVVDYNENGTNEILSAIDSIYRRFKDERLHIHRECREQCYSICHAVDIGSDPQYKTFRDYLYSYVGVMLDEYIYVLLRSESNLLNKSDYLLCIFSEDIDIDKTLCHQLRKIPQLLDEYGDVFYQSNSDAITEKINDSQNGIIDRALGQMQEWIDGHCETDDVMTISKYKEEFEGYGADTEFSAIQEENLNKYVRPFINRLFTKLGSSKIDDTLDTDFRNKLTDIIKELLNHFTEGT